MNVNKDILLQRINELCDSKHIKPNTAFTESGVGKNFKSNLTSSNPSEGKITMLANYFGVSVDYLIGRTDVPTVPETATTATDTLSPHETEVIKAYREQPDMQPAVDKILGVIEDGYILLYDAAQSESNRPPRITKMTVERWEALKNAPETDDDLL